MLFGENGSVFSKSVTESYDFDAPVTEAGDPHPRKFAAVRAVLSPPAAYHRVDPVPAALPKAAHGRVVMQHCSSLLRMRAEHTVTARTTKTFEHLGIGFGMVLYRTTAIFGGEATLNLTALRDRGTVLLDGRYQGVLGSWRKAPPRHLSGGRGKKGQLIDDDDGGGGDDDALGLAAAAAPVGSAAFDPAAVVALRSNSTTPASHEITILVENLGRPCDYGSLRVGLTVGWRGISGPTALNAAPLAEPWTMNTIDFAEL
eukprot:SAG22_NODE_4411_length_1279_cov_1.082203_2_plen_257_part_01